MKTYEKHEDACNYAKANPGLVVVRNEQSWFVGDRKSIVELHFETYEVPASWDNHAWYAYVESQKLDAEQERQIRI